ncbi:MAG: type IV secretory system conjugative DNA transfer family protein, partial [Alphaproteobacteria bacterium]|nr:type IV secretory system conjugative DNA transfer family protein [Alphaproteobacteria bacterium]
MKGLVSGRVAAACGFALAGLGIGLWLSLGEPPRQVAAATILGAVAAVVAVQLLGDRWGKNGVLLWGAGFGFFLAMAGAVWGFYVTSPLFHGVLRFSTAAMEAAMAGWEGVVLLVVPGLGGIGAVVLAISGLLAMLRGRREMKGRKRSASELYGKARFLERRWQRAMTRQKGLILGKGKDGLVAYRLEGSAMCFAPPRTGKGATIALNYLDPEERGWPGSTVLIDPRGETFPMVARRRRELGRRPILLDPFGVVARHRELEGEGLHLPVWQSEQYNPIDFIRDGPEAVRDISVLADALMEEPKNDTGNQKHFYESARSLICGYLAWVRFKMPKERRNLRTLHELLALGTEAREELFAAVDATPRFAGGLMHLAVERSRRVGKEEGGSNFTTVSN